MAQPSADASAAQISKEIGLACKSDFNEYQHASKEKSWVVVSIQAPQCQEDEEGEVSEKDRAPLELVAVIDKSGSMSSNSKLDMVKETMLFVIQQLSAKDKLGVVLYDSDVTSTGTLKKMDASGKAEITDLIERLRTGSCTNLSGGLLEGLAMIEDLQKQNAGGDTGAGKEKKTVSSILLMTDGMANEGLTSQQDIIACLTQRGRNDFYPAGEYRATSGRHQARQMLGRRQAQPQQRQQQAQQSSMLGNLVQAVNPFRFFGSSSATQSSPPMSQTNQLQQQQMPPPMQQQQMPPPMQQQQIPTQMQQQQMPPPMQPQQMAPEQLQPPLPPPAAPTPPSAGSSELSDVVAASIYTFGFGADHNATLLQALSDAGNGVYYYIDTSEKIPESFADCLGGLLSTAAQNISLEITAENGCNISEAYAGRSTKSRDSGVAITLPLGDIQSEECRDCVFCLDLPEIPEECGEWVILKAKLTCFNVITSMLEVKEALLKVRRVKELPADRSPNPDVDQHRNRITSAQVIEHASALANQGDLGGARHMLVQQQQVIRSSASNACQVTTELDRDMDRVAENLTSASRWEHGGKHLSSNIGQKHMAQRSNDTTESGYTNRMKAKKKADFSLFSKR